MIKRLLPLLLGLSVCSPALAQGVPATAQAATTHTTTTTASTTRATQPPVDALSADAVKTAITNAGYKEIWDLKFKRGAWRSEARSSNKQWVKLAVGPIKGKVHVTDATIQTQ